MAEGKKDEASGESWWGSWLTAAKEQTEKAFEMVSNDLTEFSNTMQTDTKKIVDKTKETLQPEGGENLTATDKMKQSFHSLMTGITKALTVEPEDTSPPRGKSSQHMGPHIIDRAQARLRAIQVDTGTYLREPSGPPQQYANWLKSFDFENHKGQISDLLVSMVEVRSLYTTLVPSEVSHQDFWRRYFYKLHQLELDEARKQALMMRAERAHVKEDSIGWDEEEWSGDEAGGPSGSKQRLKAAGDDTEQTQEAQQSEAQSRLQPEAQSRLQPEAQSRLQSEAQSRLQSEAQSRLQPEAQSRLQPEAQSRLQPEAQSRLQPEVQSRLQPEVAENVTTSQTRQDGDSDKDSSVVQCDGTGTHAGVKETEVASKDREPSHTAVIAGEIHKQQDKLPHEAVSEIAIPDKVHESVDSTNAMCDKDGKTVAESVEVNIPQKKAIVCTGDKQTEVGEVGENIPAKLSDKVMDKMEEKAEGKTCVDAETADGGDVKEKELKTKVKGDMVVVGERISPSSESSGNKESSTEDWEQDFDVDITAEDMAAASELAQKLNMTATEYSTLTGEDEDWENWD